MKSSNSTTGANVKIANLTLPPAVPGDVRGELVVCVENLAWNYRRPPLQVQIRLRWWGASSDTVVPWHATKGAGAAFPLTSGPRYLSRYLKDMGSIAIEVEECPGGRTVGHIHVDISTLDVCKPVEATLPLKGSKGQLLAAADVSLRVHYSALLSSFELNEHLAANDKQLPLYPAPAVHSHVQPQQQRPTTQGELASVAALTDKPHVAVEVAKTGSRSEDTSQLDQSGAMVLNAAAGATSAAMQQPSNDIATHTSTSGSKNSDQTLQPSSGLEITTIPAGDPLLDIVRKAEQLKQAMEQAAQRGICLALPQSSSVFEGLGHAAGAAAQSAPPQLSLAAAVGSPLKQPVHPLVLQQLLQPPPQQHFGWQNGLPACTGNNSYGMTATRTFVPPGLLTGTRSSSHTTALQLPFSGAAMNSVHTYSAVSPSSRLEQRAPAATLVQLPLASAAVQPCHVSTFDYNDRGSSSSYSDSQITELEDLEEIEDLLLHELFSSRRVFNSSPHSSPAASPQKQQEAHKLQIFALNVEPVAASIANDGLKPQQPSEAAAADAGQHSSHQGQPSTVAGDTPTGSASSGLLLRVELRGLQGIVAASGEPPATLSAVIKAAGHACRLDVTALIQQQQQSCDSCSGCRQCVPKIPAPACLSGPLLATDKPCFAVELWSGRVAAGDGNYSGQAAGSMSDVTEELLGIVRVPLQQQQQQTSGMSSSTSQQGPPCFAAGDFPVYDVLRGTYSGSLDLRVLLMKSVEAPLDPAETAVVPVVDGDTVGPAVSAAVDAAATAVLAVRHVISVTVHSANHLPDAKTLQDSGHEVPECRFMKYTFPGEEPLFTQEVDVVSTPVFSAHAQHTVVLPPGKCVAECLVSEESDENFGLQDAIIFEVLNKWHDDTDSLLATGSLPLQQVLQLTQLDHPASTEAAKCMRTFLVPLELVPDCGEAAVQQAGTAILLQVTISYAAVNCYSVDELEAPVDSDDQSESDAAEGTAEYAQDAPTQQSNADIAAIEVMSAGLAHVNADNAHDAAAEQIMVNLPAAANSNLNENAPVPSRGVTSDDSSGEDAALDMQQHVNSAASEATSNHSAQPVCGPADASSAEALLELKAVNEMAPVASSQPAQKHLTAELCVQVVRACGLQAAVTEAERCLNGSSGMLGRAQQLGPHPYATLSLPLPSNRMDSKAVQVLKTPFQAQTFCPQFHHRQVVPLVLDSNTLTALATGECTVELWHHCPRSQAVAAALSRGQSSSYVMAGQQQVLLASATCALQALLTKPQGIRSWLQLKSPLGQPAGAVQVALSFTHIGGQQHDVCPAADCPLMRHSELLQLLPGSPGEALQPLLVSPPEGFQRQLARVSVHIEELLLPGGDEVLLERPKIASYMASYRLPGCQIECHTHSKASSSKPSSGLLLARSWHVDWRFCSSHWVTADWRLARALQAYPLLVSVAKREPSRRSTNTGSTGGRSAHNTSSISARSASTAAGSTAEDSVLVPLGAAEIDLSPLLLQRPGISQPSCRWLSGTFAVVHPMCKHLGNTRLRVKILLDLQPAEAPPQHLLADAVAFWQISGPLAAVSAPQTTGAFLPDTAVAVTSAASSAAATSTSTGGIVAADTSLETENRLLTTKQQPEQPENWGVSAVASAVLQSDSAVPMHAGTNSSAAAAFATAEQDTKVLGANNASDARSSSIVSLVQMDVVPSVPKEADRVTQQYNSTALTESAAAPGEAASTAAIEAAMQAESSCDDVVDAVQPIPHKRTRMRAEVVHVSAPAGGRSGSSSPVAGDAVQQHQHAAVGEAEQPTVQASTGSAMMQQQQQRPEHVMVASEANSCGQQDQLPLDQQLQLPLCNLQDVRVCVESALNLTLPHSAQGMEPCLYVSYEWQPAGVVIRTPLVPANCGPLGYTASAKWFHSVYLPMVVQQQGHQHSQAPGTNQPSTMLPQVWLRMIPQSAAPELPPLYAGISAIPCEDDQLLGCATLDLSALHVLGNIEGWYNLTDEQQQPRGQIKISLAPLQQLTSPVRRSSQSCTTFVGHHEGVAVRQQCGLAATADHSAVSMLSQSDFEAVYFNPAADGTVTAGSGRSEQLELLPGHSTGLAGSGDRHAATLQHAAAVTAVPLNVCTEESLDDTDGAELMATLRANLQELDAISASLTKRATTVALSQSWQQGQGTVVLADLARAETGTSSLNNPVKQAMHPTSSAGCNCSNTQQQSDDSRASAAAEAAAARAASFRCVQTLSDDEEYMVAVGGVTESDTDTEELMGRVDWSLAQNSDDECAPGPPLNRTSTYEQQPGHSNAATATLAAAPAVSGPLNTDDWMFDISKPSGAPRPNSSSISAAVPVNPAQLSQAEAEAATTAAAERLAAAEASRAADAAARAAAEQRSRQYQAADAAVAAAAATAQRDVWQQLADLEDAEEQSLRQQQQQRSLQQQRSDTEPQDPRHLPEELEQRLDMLLANYQAAVNGPAPGAAIRTVTGDNTSSRAVGVGQWDSDDDNLADVGVDFLPAQHAAHSSSAGRGVAFANCLPPVQDDFVLEYSDGPQRLRADVQHTAAAAGAPAAVHRPSSGARTDFASRSSANAAQTYDDGLDDSEFLPAQRVVIHASSSTRVAFTNNLPPVQDDFVLEYSDGPSGLMRIVLQPCTSPTDAAATAAEAEATPDLQAAQQQQQQNAATSNNRSSWQHPAAAGASVTAVASPSQPVTVEHSSSIRGSQSDGFVPVVGQCTASMMDDMFSFSRGTSSTGGSTRLHPGMRVSTRAPTAAATAAETPVTTATGVNSSSTTAGSSRGFVPVLGQYSQAGLDNMFSFRRSGSGTRNASSSTIRHPGM